jgi:hypothetical protein
MDFETESQKKKSGVFGDVYGGITMVLPKEIDDPISLPSPPSLAPPFERRFHLPDLKLAVRVCASFSSSSSAFHSLFKLNYFSFLLLFSPRVETKSSGEKESYAENK